MKTMFQDETAGIDPVVFVEYFAGLIPQDIDPLTFEVLDGWYAIDRNSVYVCRPTSGGMRIYKIDSADVRSFKMIEGHYLYGVDDQHVFKEGMIIEGLNPGSLQIKRNGKGNVIELVSDTFSINTEI